AGVLEALPERVRAEELPVGTEIARERERARARDVAGPRVDRLDAALVTLGRACVEDHRVRPVAEAVDGELVDETNFRFSWRPRRDGRDLGYVGRQRVPCSGPRRDAAVEDAAAFVTDPPEHP